MSVTRWACVLCVYSDAAPGTENPAILARAQNLFLNPAGLQKWWRDCSFGHVDVSNSSVYGWYTLTYTAASDAANARAAKITRAMRELKDKIDFSQYYGVLVYIANAGDRSSVPFYTVAISSTVLNYNVDRSYGLILCDDLPTWFNLTFCAHEMGHCYGLTHSVDEHATSRNPGADSEPGAYWDQWDIMSGLSVYSTNSPNFGPSGPVINAANLSLRGWLPANVWQYTQVLPEPRTLTLSALGSQSSRDYLVAVYGPYFIEYRLPVGWDAAVPQSVLIHMIIGYLGASHSLMVPSSTGSDGTPVDKFAAQQGFLDHFNGYSILVESFNADGTATIVLGSTPIQPPPGSSTGVGGGGGGGSIGSGPSKPRPVHVLE